MSTDRLSLRSNALMIMDHLYHILHTSPKKYSIQTVVDPTTAGGELAPELLKNTLFSSAHFFSALFAAVGDAASSRPIPLKKRLNFDGRLLISTWETIAQGKKG